MNNFKKIIITKKTGLAVGMTAITFEYYWNTLKDVFNILSNKDLGITFDIPDNIKEPIPQELKDILSEGLKDRFEGLSAEIFYEEKTSFKNFDFEVQFFYSGVKMNRRQYFNNVIAHNIMKKKIKTAQK
tara:strand:+ start:4007 stop:4393 length:387 start_codon:yes stop_codon:yes gene_type:complete